MKRYILVMIVLAAFGMACGANDNAGSQESKGPQRAEQPADLTEAETIEVLSNLSQDSTVIAGLGTVDGIIASATGERYQGFLSFAMPSALTGPDGAALPGGDQPDGGNGFGDSPWGQIAGQDCLEMVMTAHTIDLSWAEGCAVEGQPLTGTVHIEQEYSPTEVVTTISINEFSLPNGSVSAEMVATRTLTSHRLDILSITLGGNDYHGSIEVVRDNFLGAEIHITLGGSVDGKFDVEGEINAELTNEVDRITLVGDIEARGALGGDGALANLLSLPIASGDFSFAMEQGCQSPAGEANLTALGKSYTFTLDCDGAQTFVEE